MTSSLVIISFWSWAWWHTSVKSETITHISTYLLIWFRKNTRYLMINLCQLEIFSLWRQKAKRPASKEKKYKDPSPQTLSVGSAKSLPEVKVWPAPPPPPPLPPLIPTPFISPCSPAYHRSTEYHIREWPWQVDTHFFIFIRRMSSIIGLITLTLDKQVLTAPLPPPRA